MKKLIIFIAFILLLLSRAGSASAESGVAGSSATLRKTVIISSDPRVKTLRRFFDRYNSPLADYSDYFVATADKYNLDWRLIPAISGVESTFGKRIPKGTYNAYGWANGDFRFSSWENSIELVGKTLRTKYLDRGAVTINQIARRYAPPSSSWAWKVKFFMHKIEPFPIGFDLEG